MDKYINIYYAGFKHRAGGAYYHVVNLKKGLQELGYNVQVITLDSLPVVLRYIPHIFQKVGNIIHFPFGFIYKQNVIMFLFKLFFKNSADIDIFEDIYTYWKSDTKSIVILHALWSDNLQAYKLTNKQKEELEIEEARILNEIETNVITVSQPYKEFIVSNLKSKGLNKDIDVVELGVDVDKFSSCNNSNQSIIYVGALEERKNIIFLLKVFQKLQTFKDFNLTIVGDGPLEKKLLNYVKEHNITNVNLLGRLDYESVIDELSKHQYYIHTSTKESFSYSLLEAKLSGLTTIGYSGLEVPSEFIDIKIDRFDVNEWANQILNFNQKKSFLKTNRFSYQNMTQNTLGKVK